MEQSPNPMAENIPQEDIKTGIEQVEKISSEPEQNEETREGNSVLETKPSLDLKNIADSSYIARVEEEVEKMALVSGPWASLTNSGDSVRKDAIYQESEQKKEGVSDALIESQLKGTEETTMPVSDENVMANDASSLLTADIENQPFVAATPQIRASWMSCCGLLDVLKGSGQ